MDQALLHVLRTFVDLKHYKIYVVPFYIFLLFDPYLQTPVEPTEGLASIRHSIIIHDDKMRAFRIAGFPDVL